MSMRKSLLTFNIWIGLEFEFNISIRNYIIFIEMGKCSKIENISFVIQALGYTAQHL